MLVEVEVPSAPTPDPMLQVTPELEESFATVAAKACVLPPLSDAVGGLTLTLIECGVDDDVDRPPQPAKKANEINPQKTTQILERTEVFRNIGLTSGLLTRISVLTSRSPTPCLSFRS